MASHSHAEAEKGSHTDQLRVVIVGAEWLVLEELLADLAT